MKCIFYLAIIFVGTSLISCNDSKEMVLSLSSPNPSNNISVKITTENGTEILCDPMAMIGESSADLFLITHDHHVDGQFLIGNSETPKIVSKPEEFSVGGVSIKGIAASHTEEPIDLEHPDYVFYIIEGDGLKIAYFSCLGQSEFTEEQMAQLKGVDIALINTDTILGYLSTEKALALMNQLQPKVIIPLSHGITDFKEFIPEASSITQKVDVLEGDFTISSAALKEMDQRIVILGRAHQS